MTKIPFSFYTIRFNDCDPFGHLNNSRYIDYFLNAREDHLKNDYGLQLSEFYKQGLAWVVGRHEISYLQPAKYNEIVCIQSSLLDVTDDTLVVQMQMMDEAQLYVKSQLLTTFISISTKTGKRQNQTAGFWNLQKNLNGVMTLALGMLKADFRVLPHNWK